MRSGGVYTPFAILTMLWPMMSGARQPSPWLKPYKIANNRRVLKLCRRPSNCEHLATRLRFTVSTPPIQADVYVEISLSIRDSDRVEPQKLLKSHEMV